MDTKQIKFNDKIIIVLNDGTTLEKVNPDSIFYNKLRNCINKSDYLALFDDNYAKKLLELEKVESYLNKAKTTKLLTFKDNSFYWEEVSSLSIPLDLADKILKAEADNDTILLETYKNFWTLLSLNTNEECRNNLLWFLNKWGLKVSRSGFFVAYRNVHIKESNEDPLKVVYTDDYTRTFRIKIGEMVTMDRDKCDGDSNVTCSKGLHAAHAEWLDKGSFGSIGIVVLINPADVVAVPRNSDYGKLRTCAYLPIALAEYDDCGKIIPYNHNDGFECFYVNKVIYEGILGTETETSYKIEIPVFEDKEKITNNLLEIAKKNIINRVI